MAQIEQLLQQEEILFLWAIEVGDDPIKEWQVRPVAAEAVWTKQRNLWSTFATYWISEA